MAEQRENNQIETWSGEAARAILTEAPKSRFDVLQRTLETGSKTSRLLALPKDDKLGPRIQIVPKGMKGGVDALQDQDSIDMGAGEEIDSEEIPKDAGGPKNMEEFWAWLSHAEILIPPDSMTAITSVLFAMQVDKILAISPAPKYVKNEYKEVGNAPSSFLVLAKLLYEHFGDEVLDLALALMVKCEMETKEEAKAQLAGISSGILAAPTPLKKQILEQGLGQYEKTDLEDPKKTLEVLQWALGQSFFEKLAKDSTDIPAILDSLKGVFLDREQFRYRLLEAIRRAAFIPDKAVASVFMRQGWVSLMEHSREVSDWEWFSLLKEQVEHIATDEKLQAQLFKKDSQRERFALQQKNISKFFEANQQPETAETRRLAEAIGCEELRKQLHKMEGEHNPFAYAAFQHEIASRVVRFVSRYRQSAVKEEDPVWEVGFPNHVVDKKEASCFSGPWLIAMMLFKCGISESELFYCNVNQGFNGMLGGHGSIIMQTKTNELLIFDHGYSLPGANMNAAVLGIKDASMAKKFNALMDGKKSEAVLMEIEPSVARALSIHRSMQIMPITEGFASGHLLHVGLSFLAENKLDEAEYAFQLGLSFSKKDPDLWHGVATVHFEKGRIDEAEKACMEGLSAFEGHLWTHFVLAKIYMRKGDIAGAKKHFARIAEEKNDLYKGDGMVAKAKEFAAMTDEELRAAKI